MSTISYSVFSALKSYDVPIDFSPLFLTPGVADPSYQNQTWQMNIQDEGVTMWTGDVNPDGSLAQGNAPAGFQYKGSPTCNGVMNLQVTASPPPSGCGCNGDSSGSAANPSGPTTPKSVELATGNFVFKKDMLSLVGLGSGGWSFGLNYKSNFNINGLLGKGFAYPKFMYLESLTGAYALQNDVILITDTLARVVFTNNGSGIFTPMQGNSARANLQVVNQFMVNEEYILTASNGTVTTFYGFSTYVEAGEDISMPAPGQIKSIVDRYGNTQTFVWSNTSSYVDQYHETIYDGTPQLQSVTDSYGRVTSYNYYGEEANNQLQQITDYLHRQVNFQYDADFHLVAVVTPSILKGVTGNTFPGGTAYVFQFDIENANPARQDDLIKIWYPNQTQSYLNTETRTVDVSAVYANATPRYQVTYGQNISDADSYGKVLTETLGDPENEVGGTATFGYTTCTDDLPAINLIDPLQPAPTGEPPTPPSPPSPFYAGCPIVSRTIYTDRNGNCTLYDFGASVYYTYTDSVWVMSSTPNGSVSRMEVQLNRSKNSLEVTPATTPPNPSPYVTWIQYNPQNQPLQIVYPEGNSVKYFYDDGIITDFPDTLTPYVPRVGLLLIEHRYPGNGIGIPSRAPAEGNPVLTKRYFYDPIFNQLCATIDERGNPIDTDGTYFTPQNLGTTPTDSDRSRYATVNTFDYQKDSLDVVSGDLKLQNLLGLDSGQIGTLIGFVSDEMQTPGGLPAGFPIGLGDINGDGTGSGTSSNASHLGNVVMITRPSVLLTDGTTQDRVELFTVNLVGQVTTATDPEGNLTVTTRYPENDPEGTGQNIASTGSTQQYGLIREIHQDANPDDVMNLVGASGDLVAFVPNLTERYNTPGVYQDLITRYEGSSSGSSGCVSCGYDAMGNVLSQTDPGGFTTIYDRNEMDEIYRTTAAAPYSFKVETTYDANRNIIQVDTEDWQVQYNSSSPTNPGYGTFTPSDEGAATQVPMIPGPGGALRPGWFSNLMTYDILDNKIEEDIDATGSTPSTLITTYQYDSNQNLILITKPAGNTVEYDYDERNLKIAERVGGASGAVTAYSYDGNKNLINIISPLNRTGLPGTALTIYIADAFGSGSMLTHSGDWTLENSYDGFDRVVQAMDAVGNFDTLTYDPTSALIEKVTTGPYGGASPIVRTGGGVPLVDTIMRYDEARRLYEQQQQVFFPGVNFPDDRTIYSERTITHIGGGLAANSTLNNNTGSTILTTTGGMTPPTTYALTRTVYDRSGRVFATLADIVSVDGVNSITTHHYDGANRRILTTDPLNNTVATQYDGNGNPVQVTRTDVCTITAPTIANEVFVSFAWYDCLNRPVVTGTQGADGCLTSNLNLCCPWMGLPSTLYSLMGYDSRGNRTTVTDPKLNVIVSIYDGASRLIETQQEMRQNGDGRSTPAPNQTFLSPRGIIRTEYVYDGNSRLVELIDDRGASTSYAYDLLDRLVTKTLADGSCSTRVYDLANDLTSYTDENGSLFTFTYDAVGRKITTVIAAATGVGGTTGQTFQYDGLSRLTQAIDTVGSLSQQVDFTYDSIGRLLEEQQYNGEGGYLRESCTTHMTFKSYPAIYVAYPAATDTIINNYVTNSYDLLYRRISFSGVQNGAYGTYDTVAWQFFGSKRIVETVWGSNSLIVTQMNNARTNSAVQATVPLPGWGNISSDQLGYDGVGRMITKRYLTGGINETTNAYNDTTSLVGFTTSYDRASNKLYERQLHCEERSSLYQSFNSNGRFAVGYDSANRLCQYQRGVLSSATVPYLVNAGASITAPITLPGTDQVKTYGLDGLGNWKTSNFTQVGSGGTTTSTAEMRQHNYVNEITGIRDTTGGTSTTVPFSYDHGDNAASPEPTVQIRGNGNLVNDGTRIYQYDAFNRLITISNTSSTVIASYVYDAFNRRIQKTIANLGGTGYGGLTGDIPAGTTNYLYDGPQIVEERNDASPGVVVQAYFWGQYVDELMFFINASGTPYRVLSDLMYRSVATVTTSNAITEAFDTDAYGNTLCFSGSGTDGYWFTDDDVRTNSPINCTIFTGRQYDPESQIYYYRARYYSPKIGRFVSRDPLADPKMRLPSSGYLGLSPVAMGRLRLAFGRLDPSGYLVFRLERHDREPRRNAELMEGPNLYWYVHNNPSRFTDPTGLDGVSRGTSVAQAKAAAVAQAQETQDELDNAYMQMGYPNAYQNTFPGNMSLFNLFNGNSEDFLEETSKDVARTMGMDLAAKLCPEAFGLAAEADAPLSLGLTAASTFADAMTQAMNNFAQSASYNQNTANPDPPSNAAIEAIVNGTAGTVDPNDEILRGLGNGN